MSKYQLQVPMTVLAIKKTNTSGIQRWADIRNINTLNENVKKKKKRIIQT